MIYNGLTDVADEFDIFLFDAYGVFWEGNDFYPNSLNIMSTLVKNAKKVVIISNTTRLQKDIMDNYEKKGMTYLKDYTHFYTSGDLLQQNLREENISFKSCPHPQKYYVVGLSHRKAFAGTNYIRVKNLNEADFVYIGVPFMFADDIEKYPQYKSEYWPAVKDKNGNITMWDTLTPKPFEKIINKIIKKNLPVLNANPDFYAKEGHPMIPDSPAVFVVRNGLITEMLREKGAEIIEYGKPHKNIYDYVFEQLKQEKITINKSRICMIGDTVRTDIKGAVNANITPVLCVQTGITAEEISRGNSVQNLCNRENIDVKKIIQIKSVGGII